MKTTIDLAYLKSSIFFLVIQILLVYSVKDILYQIVFSVTRLERARLSKIRVLLGVTLHALKSVALHLKVSLNLAQTVTPLSASFTTLSAFSGK
jgi:predicted unusual protein kinase regulating ubiquinone biosynthesis (AarF/ABC1/UbiB family)